MYKKIIIMLLCCMCLGCSKKIETKKVETPTKGETKEEYKDNNTMPIGFYKIKSYGVLQKVEDSNSVFEEGTDIFFNQIYPSQEDQIKLNNGFGEDFYKKWNELDKSKTHKIGFHIKYTLYGNQEVSYNIFDPDTAMTKYEYILVYLYDDYINRKESWYSHMEQKDFNENSNITSIKLSCNTGCAYVTSDVELTVFTYDSDDDFDENKMYRGNSKYTIKIHSVDS